ncbi:MAG: hypothetical protein DI585_03690 [Pseudomonas fluorescens]|nr:MAG: hypothetical protein DI585_03690 [Pseudomonas fluorescens]
MILRDFYDRSRGLNLTDTHTCGTTCAYESETFHGFFVDIQPPVYILKTGQGPLLGLVNTTVTLSSGVHLELTEDDFGRWLIATQGEFELARTSAPYAEDSDNDFFIWLMENYQTEDFRETYTLNVVMG